jgi:hypothetical protein
MSIFTPKHDSDNRTNFIWQTIAGSLTKLLGNHPTDRFGMRVGARELRKSATGDFNDGAECFPQRADQRHSKGRSKKTRPAESAAEST